MSPLANHLKQLRGGDRKFLDHLLMRRKCLERTSPSYSFDQQGVACSRGRVTPNELLVILRRVTMFTYGAWRFKTLSKRHRCPRRRPRTDPLISVIGESALEEGLELQSSALNVP
jgi:hypothetical protein